MKKKNRLSFKILLVILLSFLLLTTVSYAWFYAEVNLGGNIIETDSLEYEVYGYNADGTLRISERFKDAYYLKGGLV